MFGYKKIFRNLLLMLVSSSYADYSLNVVNLYPGNLTVSGGSGTGDAVPQDIFVWGIPKNAKPLLLARITFGSEGAFSWPDTLTTLYFFNSAQAISFGDLVKKGETDSLRANLALFGGNRVFAYDGAAIPPSGSKLYVVAGIGPNPLASNPVMVVQSIAEVAKSLNALAAQPPQLPTNLTPVKSTDPRAAQAPALIPIWGGTMPWINTMLNFVTMLNAKLPLLSINDPGVNAAVNAIYKRFTDMKPKAQAIIDKNTQLQKQAALGAGGIQTLMYTQFENLGLIK